VVSDAYCAGLGPHDHPAKKVVGTIYR